VVVIWAEKCSNSLRMADNGSWTTASLSGGADGAWSTTTTLSARLIGCPAPPNSLRMADNGPWTTASLSASGFVTRDPSPPAGLPERLVIVLGPISPKRSLQAWRNLKWQTTAGFGRLAA
jgi:hypothetical protein